MSSNVFLPSIEDIIKGDVYEGQMSKDKPKSCLQ